MSTQKINALEIGNKFQSKNEIYRFLVTEANMHLPPQKECSIYFVRDVLSGIKKAFFNDEIQVKVVPHIENLRIKDFIWFLENKCENATEYLPDDYEKKSINRQWLCNLCIIYFVIFLGNTFNKEGFEELISAAIKERQDKYIEKNSMIIETDPRIVSAFENSNFVSTTKGRSHLLIRKRKPHSSLNQVDEEVKVGIKTNNEKDKKIEELKSEIKDLKEAMKFNEEDNDKTDKYAELLNDLFHKGIIDETGKFIQEDE